MNFFHFYRNAIWYTETTATLSFRCTHIHHLSDFTLKKTQWGWVRQPGTRMGGWVKAASLCHRRGSPTLMGSNTTRQEPRDTGSLKSHTWETDCLHVHGNFKWFLPWGLCLDLSPAFGYMFPFCSKATRLHVKLLKASDPAENAARMVHFHWDLNSGGRKLT